MRPRSRLRRGKGLRRTSGAFLSVRRLEYSWSILVRARDRRCQWDGCTETGRLESHHVHPKGKYPDLRLVVDNGLSLCPKHHRAAHAGMKAFRKWWAARWPERAASLERLLRPPAL